jgi:hypothetical protein
MTCVELSCAWISFTVPRFSQAQEQRRFPIRFATDFEEPIGDDRAFFRRSQPAKQVTDL